MSGEDEVRLRIYQHYKTGCFYRVIAVGKHSETLEEVVIYEALYDNPDGKYWVRPKKMFLETVTFNRQTRPRFSYIKAT